MSLQQQRIAASVRRAEAACPEYERSALAQRAADTQASFAGFLTSLLQTEQVLPPIPGASISSVIHEANQRLISRRAYAFISQCRWHP
jgi:hypothetical protein